MNPDPTPKPKPQYADTPGDVSHIVEAPNEVLSTMNKDGSRKWMYPRPSYGSMYRRRKVVGWGLIVLFFGLPILKIGGEPAVWLDFVRRRFAIFGQVFYATDTLLLMLLGLTLVLAVVWATALFGRVWCGWGCPQTVYMEFIFRPIDRLIEGTVAQQRRRDKKGWTQDKVWRTAAKLTLYTLIAAAMAHSFVAYFVSWGVLLEWMTGAPGKHWGFFMLMGATTALIVFDFAYFREQMCTIACPYARLQSVLLDPDSLIVSYDPGRGESRGRRSRTQREQEKQGIKLNLGDCIDCGACVRTCPTGIDIRDGLQLECIGCTQCIDACDAIMIGVDKEPGLIRYTSENKVEHKPSKFLRPRVLIYTGLLLLFSGVLVYMATHTSGFEVGMVRATGEPFVVLPDGQVSNHFKLRAQNRTSTTRQLGVSVDPAHDEVLIRAQNDAKFALDPGQTKRIDLWVVMPESEFKSGQNKIKIHVGDGTDFDQIVDVELLGPVSAKPASTSP